MRRIEQQTPRRLSLELCTFRFHEIDPSLCTCLRFKTIISKCNRHDMKRKTSCKFVVLLHSPLQCTWLTIFRTTSSAFPTSKHANYRIIQNHRVLDLTSHPALDPRPVKLGREPKMAAFGLTLTGHKNSRI